MTTSNTLSLPDEKLIQSPISSKWAVLDTGMNSVKPSIRPRNRALNINHTLSVLYSHCRLHRPDRKGVVKGKAVSVRLVMGGRRLLKKKKTVPSNRKIQHK